MWSSMPARGYRCAVAPARGEPLARTPRPRLRAPGRGLGGAVVDAVRPSPCARARCDRDRARRPRHRRPPSRGLPRRHGRPDHQRPRADPHHDLGGAAGARQRLLVRPRSRRDPGPRTRGRTRTGDGPRPPRSSASPRSTRCSTSLDDHPARRAQPRHQADRAQPSSPTRSSWPASLGPTARHRPGDRGVVPRRRHRRVRRVRPRHRHLGRARSPRPCSGGRCTKARSRPPSAHVALQVPAAQGDLVVVDELLVAAAHERGHGRARVDDQRRARDGPPPRPGRRRDHLGPAHAARGAWSRRRDLAYRP